jgi:hypothetical protein
MHFINMQAFLQDFQAAYKANKTNKTISNNMFTNWLALITHADNPNKEALAQICNQTEELKMAAQVLANLSADKMARIEYEQYLDALQMHNYIAQDRERLAGENYSLAQQVNSLAQQINTALQQTFLLAKTLHNKGTPLAEIAKLLDKTEHEVTQLINN